MTAPIIAAIAPAPLTTEPHDRVALLERAYHACCRAEVRAAYAGAPTADLARATAEAREAYRAAKAAAPQPAPTVRPECVNGHAVNGPPCSALCVRGTGHRRGWGWR